MCTVVQQPSVHRKTGWLKINNNMYKPFETSCLNFLNKLFTILNKLCEIYTTCLNYFKQLVAMFIC